MVANKIITISGQPVTGKGTNVRALKDKLKEKGYLDKNIHVISTGDEFRSYFNSIFEFIKDLDDIENIGEIEDISDNQYLKRFFDKREYRQTLLDTILELKRNNIDVKNSNIEQANNLREFRGLRKVIDTLIDKGIEEKGKEINLKSMPDEIWIIDSRLAFHNIPKSFSVRLTANSKVAGERLFYDKKRGAEDNKYTSIEEAQEAREKRRIGEQERYIKRYGVDLEDENNYNLIIDTSYSTIDDISDTILTCLDYYTQGREFCKKWASPKTLLPLQSERATLSRGESRGNFEEMEESIKQNGYMPNIPIEIIEVDGYKYIIEGHHKNFASAHLNKTLVPYQVIAKDDEEIPEYGGIARKRANEIRNEFLYGHEWLIGEDFSYNEIYPGIYEQISKNEDQR